MHHDLGTGILAEIKAAVHWGLGFPCLRLYQLAVWSSEAIMRPIEYCHSYST
jgi:hypothetical protein